MRVGVMFCGRKSARDEFRILIEQAAASMLLAEYRYLNGIFWALND